MYRFWGSGAFFSSKRGPKTDQIQQKVLFRRHWTARVMFLGAQRPLAQPKSPKRIILYKIEGFGTASVTKLDHYVRNRRLWYRLCLQIGPLYTKLMDINMRTDILLYSMYTYCCTEHSYVTYSLLYRTQLQNNPNFRLYVQIRRVRLYVVQKHVRAHSVYLCT